MASELSKIGLPKVDKLCDAKWVKTIFNTSKKEFAQFVEQETDLRDFMSGLEDRIGDAHDEFRDLIRKYLERVSISDKAEAFKSKLKEQEKEQKRLKKKEEAEAKKIDREIMKEQLRKELLAEMEDEQNKSSLEAAVGVIPRKKISFKNNDIRRQDESEDESEDNSSLKSEDQHEEISRKKVIFKKHIEDVSKEIENEKNNKKMDLATLSAFIVKTASMGHLGIVDQNEHLLHFVRCDIVKNSIQLSVQVDFEAILGSMIREGRFKMKNSKGKTINVIEMSSGSKGKVELVVE